MGETGVDIRFVTVTLIMVAAPMLSGSITPLIWIEVLGLDAWDMYAPDTPTKATVSAITIIKDGVSRLRKILRKVPAGGRQAILGSLVLSDSLKFGPPSRQSSITSGNSQ